MKNLINVIKITSITQKNQVEPQNDEVDEDDDDELQILITSQLEYFIHKLEDEEEVIFETDEEAIIARSIIEEVSG